jgi:hypothetical protein
VDGGTIFIYVLTATFFGVIAYLAVLSRRRRTDAAKLEDKRPRKVA